MRALMLIAVLAASVAAAQPFYSTGAPTSGALAPSSVTTPFVDAGTVTAPVVCLNAACAMYIKANGSDLDLVTPGNNPIKLLNSSGIASFPYGFQVHGGSALDCSTTICDFGSSAPRANGRGIPSAAPTDGGTTQVYEEYGNCTLSGSACAATFKNAFSAPPICVCSHVAAVPLACGPTAAPITSGTTFAVATGTGTVAWHCHGDR